MNFTKETLRVWTNENHADVLAIKDAELNHKTIKAHVATYTEEYFAAVENTFKGGHFEDIQEAIEVDDNDKAADAYYAGLDAVHAANGYDIPEGHCPDHIAALALMDARKKVVKSLCKVLELRFETLPMNNFDRMLEIIMKIVAK